MGVLEIAKSVQDNLKAEGQAISDYTSLLILIANSTLEQQEQQEVSAIINELIADELNHEKKLNELYSSLTEIEAKND